MNLSLYEFNIMNNDDRAEYVRAHGSFIGDVKLGKHTFVLYTVSDFFVEFVVERENISSIDSFKNGFKMEKYLNKIKIDTF